MVALVKRVTLNIGLVPGDAQKGLNPSACAMLWQDDRLAAACRWAVDKLQGPVMIHRHAGSEAHEPFVVLEGTQVQVDELFDREVYRLAAYLDQDCIAVQAHSIGTGVREPGRLVGPFTKAWEPFRQTLFHTIPRPTVRMADPGIIDRLA